MLDTFDAACGVDREGRLARGESRPRATNVNGSAGASPSQLVSSQAEPVQASPSPEESPAPIRRRKRKPWSPGPKEHLVFQWVKFEGKPQHWVASQLNMNQGTVSRIVERYERWQAHFQPGDPGRLDPAERLRAQRWLTYERNEQILASALRIAGEMEGFVDVSKSTVQHPFARPSEERAVRTQHATLDRSGIAARFLRLAHRINMDQLELVEREPLDPLPPLSDETMEEWDETLDAEPIVQDEEYREEVPTADAENFDPQTLLGKPAVAPQAQVEATDLRRITRIAVTGQKSAQVLIQIAVATRIAERIKIVLPRIRPRRTAGRSRNSPTATKLFEPVLSCYSGGC